MFRGAVVKWLRLRLSIERSDVWGPPWSVLVAWGWGNITQPRKITKKKLHVVLKQGHNSGSPWWAVQLVCWSYPSWINDLRTLNIFCQKSVKFNRFSSRTSREAKFITFSWKMYRIKGRRKIRGYESHWQGQSCYLCYHRIREKNGSQTFFGLSKQIVLMQFLYHSKNSHNLISQVITQAERNVTAKQIFSNQSRNYKCYVWRHFCSRQPWQFYSRQPWQFISMCF